jgi:polar amino acid transport system substrate-binding protein
MKKIKAIAAALAASFLLIGCDEKKDENVIKFALSADYPPFEFYEDGKLTGFDVELAELIAKKLNKKAEFKDMQFAAILAALQNGSVDAAASAMAASEERRKNYDFSDEYYAESFVTVYKKDTPVTEPGQLNNVKIVCQLGTTMEMWLKEHFPNASLKTFDNNNQVIEELKAGRAECAVMDKEQGAAFCAKNDGLAHSFIAKSDNGYAVAMKKGSPLKDQINKALKELEAEGEIQKLEKKWTEKE